MMRYLLTPKFSIFDILGWLVIVQLASTYSAWFCLLAIPFGVLSAWLEHELN